MTDDRTTPESWADGTPLPPEPGAEPGLRLVPALTDDREDDAPLGVIAPPRLSPNALYGLAGDVCRAIAPHSEADPAALLATFLAWSGAIIGPDPHLMLGDSKHSARVWPLIVGRSASGAKGTSWSAIRRIMHAAAPQFGTNIVTGLSTGEGLIELVRDGTGDDPDAPGFDEGVHDKRLLVYESEYATVLDRGRREGSSLSAVLRQAWEAEPLQVSNRKQNALYATNHHIVVVGHVTPVELKAKLRESDLYGGSFNRTLPLYSSRTRLMPLGGNTPDELVDLLAERITSALASARVHRRVTLTTAAEHLWEPIYRHEKADREDSPLVAATSRSAPTILRLALIYALLDGADQIDADHLVAAHALWEYSAETSRWLFSTAAADAAQHQFDRVQEFITAGGKNGVTRNDIRESLFQRNKSAREIDAILAPLVAAGRVEETTRPTKGRPVTVYRIPNRSTAPERTP
ncbi:DUF3987 domain-containing protein [Dietzia cinnamea]|uniref:DUF3987 domain-containing protein n=1 Tax=Dietzia cinnamea TaxID=321318 RepID=UPI0015E820E9|nr:DUF3987 domain-containing protein [Dietzia cinnamea]